MTWKEEWTKVLSDLADETWETDEDPEMEAYAMQYILESKYLLEHQDGELKKFILGWADHWYQEEYDDLSSMLIDDVLEGRTLEVREDLAQRLKVLLEVRRYLK